MAIVGSRPGGDRVRTACHTVLSPRDQTQSCDRLGRYCQFLVRCDSALFARLALTASHIQAFLEGKPSTTSAELATRFWNLVPHALGSVITSDSFAGYHLVHIFMFWGKLVCLYGIFRRLNVAAYMAFLVTMLFMVYPVNSLLMSLRSYPLTFNVLSLLGLQPI